MIILFATIRTYWITITLFTLAVTKYYKQKYPSYLRYFSRKERDESFAYYKNTGSDTEVSP
jgi:hypothetical protein